jgi:hypothetical protein
MKSIFKIAVVMFIASLLAMVSIVYAQGEEMNVDTTSPTMENLNAVAVVGNTTTTPTLENSNAWAVGDNGTIIEWTDMSWENVTSDTTMHLYDIVMINATSGLAVGGDDENGIILQYMDGEWSTMNLDFSLNETLYGVTASSSGTPAWAVGANGMILMWDGNAWSIETSPTDYDLHSVAMVHESEDVWAVGENGVILHYDGTSWFTMTSPTNMDLNAIAMINTTSGWAVGGDIDTGVILNMNGSSWDTWEKINFGGAVDTTYGYVADTVNATLTSLSIDTANSAWAVGASGIVLYWGGEDWMGQVDVLGGIDFNGVAVVHGAAEGSSYAWAVGDDGEIIAWTGTSWIPEYPIIAVPVILGMIALAALIGKFRINRKISV